MFHQVEGLVIDKNIHMGHLKGVLMDFVSAFFETDVDVQFRPHHFPFTEPSAEMDVRYERDGARLKLEQAKVGWKFSVAAWSIQMSCAPAMWTPTNIRALPSGWASTALPC